jgi:hypothetical protein
MAKTQVPHFSFNGTIDIVAIGVVVISGGSYVT